MPRKVIKLISFLLCVCLLFQQTGFAQVAGQLDISGHILSLRNSFIQDKFRPLHLRYLSYDNQANNFRLLLDKGDSEKGLPPKGTVPEEKLKEETKTLLNYFFIGISLPNDSFWVNLRPDSENEVIDPELGKTDVGKILLEADLQLKKDTAQFTSPETLEGKKYWDKLYKKAEELFGYENITIPTLTRPWIVPDEIIIRETQDNAYIYKATLKVMLEQDYLKDSSTYNFKDPRLKALNEYSSQLIRELIIPKLTKEINSSKRYAPLRQVYYSLILAQWFKQRFYGKGGLYSWLIDKKNLNGLTSKTPWSKTTYFQAYQKSFKEGEYNLKEPIYTPYGQTIRSYMSGGIDLQDMQSAVGPHGAISGKRPFNFLNVLRGFLASALVLGATNIAEPAEVKVVLQEKPPLEIALQSVTGLAQDNAPKATVQQEEQVEIDKKVEEKVASKKRSEISLISTQLETPEEIELSEIAHIKLEPYIDYKLYKLKNKPIYYVEFASRAVQNSTFDRLSAFVESETYPGRILEDEELKNAIETGRLTQGIGHDYKIEDICRFYTQAKNRNVVLNAWEENLKKDLIRLGIIEYRDAIYKPTKKIAVISAAQDIGGLRIDTILHEFRHAIYLTEPFVRESIKKVWDSVDPNQRSKIITAVHVLADYDRKNLDLILNELYASLLDYSSPLSGIVSNNPKGWAPSPEAMSYLFAEFKRIEENRLINGVMGSTFFKNFLEDVNKRLYISKPTATESEPSSSRSTRDSAEPAEVKVALQERPPIEIIAGLAQDNASKATVQQKEQVEIDKGAGEKVKEIFKSFKKEVKKETGEEIFLDPQTLERYVGYLKSYFQGDYKALARFMREEERDDRKLLSHQRDPTSLQLEAIKSAEGIVKDYLRSLGLPYKSIRIVFFSGDRLSGKHKIVFGGGLYVPLYHMIVFDASLNAESLFGFLVHEILHANSFIHKPQLLSEGMTEYIKIVLLMSKEGQHDFSPRAIFSYSDESDEKLKEKGLSSSFSYEAELLAIAHLAEKIGMEPILKAYFEGDYNQIEQALGKESWRKIEDLARQFGKTKLVTEDYVKGILKILEEVKTPAPAAGQADAKPLSRGKETYGFELNGQITIDADKARRLFSAEFNDLKQAFARQRKKTADTLIEEELKELSNRFTGFIHVHEIFHQLIREANLSLEKDKEEALANILAKIAFGIASPAEIQEFEKFIQRLPQGSQLRNQLTQLKETRYDDLTNSFLVNLTRLGVEYTQNINISTISGSNIPEGAKAMSKSGEEESRSRVLFKDTEEDTEEIAYVKPIKLTLSPNMEGSLTLWIYKFEDIPDTWPVKYRINRNVGYFIIKENGPADEYKGLRDGEEVILGRYNPGRFEGFGSGFISRSHVKISRKKDTIVIEDTSTHGTLLEWVEGVITKQPRDKSVQQIREMIGRENLPCTNGRKDLVLLNGRVADERLNEIEDKLVNGGTIDQSTGGFLKKELEEIRQEISLILQLFKRFSNPNYRERLGLLRGADNGEVKKQYRKLMLEFHPDRYGNDERPRPISQHVAAEIAKLIGEAYKHTYSPLAEPGRGPGGGSRLESPNNKVKEAEELLNQGKALEASNLLREAIEVYNAIIRDEKDASEGTLGFEMRKAAEKNLEVARELLKQAEEQIKTQPPADTEKESHPADASSVTSKTADNFSEEELSISYIAKNDFQRNETYRNERYKERLFIPMMLKKLFKNYEAFKGKKMLELGCGPHTQTIDFLSSKGIDITGVDVLRLVEHPLVKKADMYEYLKTLKDKSLDVIYSSGVFEIRGLLIGLTRTSFTNYDKFKEMVSRVLTESKRVLKDDGYIIVYVYEKEAALSEKELKELGFTIIESEPTISSNYIWVLKKADEKSAQTNQGPNNISSDKGGIDGSTGSPSTPETGKKGLGGVDFRGLPIVTQPMQPPLGIVPLGAQVRPLSGTVPFINLDEEWSQIERMLNSGIIPSSQRIKEYLEVSCSSQDCSERIDRVLSGIADILRLEEERVSATEPALREMLVLLESDKPASAIQTALSKITVAPKEPALVK